MRPCTDWTIAWSPSLKLSTGTHRDNEWPIETISWLFQQLWPLTQEKKEKKKKKRFAAMSLFCLIHHMSERLHFCNISHRGYLCFERVGSCSIITMKFEKLRFYEHCSDPAEQAAVFNGIFSPNRGDNGFNNGWKGTFLHPRMDSLRGLTTYNLCT